MSLNATVGAVDANSYVTLAEAEAYFLDRPHVSSWDSWTEKSESLILASQMLDWYAVWKGNKTTETQSMGWPRENAVRRDGTEIDDDIIPSDVKTAVYELALSSVSEDRTADSALAGIEQLKAGSLMLKADSGDVDSTAKKTIPEKIWKILSDLTTYSGFGVVRLIRG